MNAHMYARLAVQNYATYPSMPGALRALCPVRRGVTPGIRPLCPVSEAAGTAASVSQPVSGALRGHACAAKSRKPAWNSVRVAACVSAPARYPTTASQSCMSSSVRRRWRQSSGGRRRRPALIPRRGFRRCSEECCRNCPLLSLIAVCSSRLQRQPSTRLQRGLDSGTGGSRTSAPRRRLGGRRLGGRRLGGRRLGRSGGGGVCAARSCSGR